MMRFFRNTALMAPMLIAMLACQKIENPSQHSSSLKFRVDVENMGVGTKAGENSNPGPDYFYLFGWYRNGNEYGAAGIAYYTTSHGTDNWDKYTLRENGDYVVQQESTVENNPEWRKAQYTWEEGAVLSKFWACTNWGSSRPNLQATAHGGADEQDLFKASYLNYDNMLDASQQSDFMVAYSRKIQGAEVEDDILHLTFKHTLSKITFEDKTNGAITSLKVNGTYESGNLEFKSDGTIEWSDGGTPWRTKTMTGGNGSMYLIPQTTTSDAPVTITIVMQDGTEKTKSINVNWQVGYEYTYGLNLAATKTARTGDGDFFIECLSERKY